MAAPCRRMWSGSLSQVMSLCSRTALRNTGFRSISSTYACRGTPRAKDVPERASSPWTVMAAVCLQRLPVISAEMKPVEQRFMQMMQQVSPTSHKNSGDPQQKYRLLYLQNVNISLLSHVIICCDRYTKYLE